MKNNNTVIIVDAPNINALESEKAGDILLNFYRGLGWNGNDILDPCKVITTTEVYNRIYDAIYDKCPDSVGVGMLMVNQGPSTNNDVSKDKVHLLEGWIKS